MCAGEFLHMVDPHPLYRPFDVDTPFCHDVKGQDGGPKNKFMNRAGAYYMYKCFPMSCLANLMPASSSDADIEALCAKEIPAGTGSADAKIRMMSPELAALLAAYIQIAPWKDHDFKKDADTAPPVLQYYDRQLEYFSSFRREFCKDRIEKCLKEFYQKFPNAIKEIPKGRCSSSGIALADDDDAVEIAEDELPL